MTHKNSVVANTTTTLKKSKFLELPQSAAYLFSGGEASDIYKETIQEIVTNRENQIAKA